MGFWISAQLFNIWPSSKFLNLSDTQSLHWQNNNLSLKDVVQIKWDKDVWKQDQANDKHLVNSNCFTETCLIIQKSERIKYGKNS